MCLYSVTGQSLLHKLQVEIDVVTACHIFCLEWEEVRFLVPASLNQPPKSDLQLLSIRDLLFTCCTADMDEDTLRIVIAPKLDIPYLQPTTAPPVWQNNTVSGILWGFQSRPFYALTGM